ncbi:glutamyl aminopeptidase [Carnobacteriaceae bacterium zg-84]|nr:glutamyl aminopeptidase [Granulicatella sp. zg-84]NEW65854.1 glutamyl aminopeptidase [Granulicatella sp. zg-84]QMI86391.1 glutamyl aminopeptidase [Carnobacteriaceae bacterium zg-84]
MINEETFKRIKQLTELQATSGFEHNVREYMKTQLAPLVDKIEQDGLGGVFGVREHQDKQAPRVMFAAHMDEVGFMVTHITDRGLFKVTSLGGWNPYVVSAQRFTLQTKQGDYTCVSSSVPPHLLRGTNQSGDISIDNILFDAGFESKDEAIAYGVRPGDTIVPKVETELLANKKRIVSKAWDNRYGCAVLLDALQTVKDDTLKSTIIAGANVQEEVGLRGAKGSTVLCQPDVFFAVDCSPADDLQTTNGTFGHLGKGTLLRILDPGFILLKGMKEYLLDTAETHGIPYQYFVSKGGTDAGAAHQMNTGIPSAVIGVCARYIHTHQTIFAIEDYEAAKEMIVHIMRTFDSSTLDTIKRMNG